MCNTLEQEREASTGFKMSQAIIELVCPETRVKFKNIDFQTEADFACYCTYFICSLVSGLLQFNFS
jgi:hypothetical protein